MTDYAPAARAAAALVESLSHAHLILDAEGWRRLDALRAELAAAGLGDGYAWAEAPVDPSERERGP